MPILGQTSFLLVLSNVFMTFAWYAHLRNLHDKPWDIAALVSWGIALCEYLLQVPANRIGYTAFSLPQLKILQEVITLSVFVPFAVFYMQQPIKLDYLGAELCLPGAMYFIFPHTTRYGHEVHNAETAPHIPLGCPVARHPRGKSSAIYLLSPYSHWVRSSVSTFGAKGACRA
jgi:uncharacterized protein (DUF486 family)